MLFQYVGPDGVSSKNTGFHPPLRASSRQTKKHNLTASNILSLVVGTNENKPILTSYCLPSTRHLSLEQSIERSDNAGRRVLIRETGTAEHDQKCNPK